MRAEDSAARDLPRLLKLHPLPQRTLPEKLSAGGVALCAELRAAVELALSTTPTA